MVEYNVQWDTYHLHFDIPREVIRDLVESSFSSYEDLCEYYVLNEINKCVNDYVRRFRNGKKCTTKPCKESE